MTDIEIGKLLAKFQTPEYIEYCQKEYPKIDELIGATDQGAVLPIGHVREICMIYAERRELELLKSIQRKGNETGKTLAISGDGWDIITANIDTEYNDDFASLLKYLKDDI